MQYPFYDLSVPVFVKQLNNLIGILEKAEQFASERKVSESVMLQSRLYVDMLPLIRQIQIASDNAKGTAARIAGVDFPKMEDTETSFAELRERLVKTVNFLNTLKPAQFEHAATQKVHLQYFPDKHFLGADFLPFYGIPNFFFHVTTAYGILRHLGVNIGKADYIAGTPMHDD